MVQQATIFLPQSRFEEGRDELLRAAEAYEKIGATLDAEKWRQFCKNIRIEEQVAPDTSDANGEPFDFQKCFHLPRSLSLKSKLSEPIENINCCLNSIKSVFVQVVDNPYLYGGSAHI